jgi:hypothetical protein
MVASGFSVRLSVLQGWPFCPPGFLPDCSRRLPKRWVVERTLGWINRARRLSKDFEATIESALAWLHLAFVFLLMRTHAKAGKAENRPDVKFVSDYHLTCFCLSLIGSTRSILFHSKIEQTHVVVFVEPGADNGVVVGGVLVEDAVSDLVDLAMGLVECVFAGPVTSNGSVRIGNATLASTALCSTPPPASFPG